MSSTRRNLIALVALNALIGLAAAPAAAQTVYAAVWGHPKHVVGSSTLHSGLYGSTDLGRTWTHLGPRNLKTFSVAVVDSSRGRILYIAAGNGVHRSLDSGRTWRIVTDWRMTEVLDVDVDQSDPRRVLAATAYGLWISEDGGDTWTNPAGALQHAFVREIRGTGAFVEDRHYGAPQQAWSTADAGRTWTFVGRYDADPLRIDSFDVAQLRRVEIGRTRLAATWGGGVYRNDGEGWLASGLEERQVWRLVVTEY